MIGGRVEQQPGRDGRDPGSPGQRRRPDWVAAARVGIGAQTVKKETKSMSQKVIE